MRTLAPDVRKGYGVWPQLLVAIILLCGALAMVLRPSSARAASGIAQFSLQQALAPGQVTAAPYFVLSGRPGGTVSATVRVTNNGTAQGMAYIYGVDATTGKTSGAVYQNRSSPRVDVGAWLSLSTSQVTLAPGKSQLVTFKVTVPRSVRPGQHLGGIVAENAAQQQASNGGSVAISIQQLSILAVEVDVPGAAVEQLTAQHVNPGGAHSYQVLYVGLSNPGDEMIKPYGSLQIVDGRGNTLKSIALKLDTFVPQTTIDYPVYVPGQALGAGQYEARLTLTYGAGHVLHYTTTFSISQADLQQVFGSRAANSLPPAAAGVSLVVLGLGVGGVLLLCLIAVLLLAPGARALALPFARKS